MKLVIVGWLAALVSFSIGFALGRRRSRRDAARDAMLQMSATLAVYSMARGLDRLPTDEKKNERGPE